MDIVCKSLVAGEVFAGIGILCQIDARHVVEQRGDRLLQIGDLRSLLEHVPLLVRQTICAQLLPQQDQNDGEHDDQDAEHDQPVVLHELHEGDLLLCKHIGRQ